ncbi:hypothetical protein MFRU_001g01310 [Monilinia fructicola]|uniref:Phosphoglycerate mutase family protein n=1 Tax=Monilinia fructicola TaxID=38448 RepID=A0A5M9JWZ3_MONFR|nr:hypothetical protein EYC84_005580 [Monilinia fructicola]KAG4035361.1 hypothetical protein MFRU_001g01310 [Monilinia fructicola]
MALYARIKQYLDPPAPVMEARVFVHLMRHGEAYHNLGHSNDQINVQSYAIPDPSLTDEGIKQAKAARERMAERCAVPDLVLTSPLARTIETTLHIFPVVNNGSRAPQPQIVAYDDLRESGAYLCNVRQDLTVLIDGYSHKGIDFATLSPVVPPIKSVIRTAQRSHVVRKEILSIAKIIRQGGGIWKGIYIQGPSVKNVGRYRGSNASKDIHIVVVSHGSFMKHLLPGKLYPQVYQLPGQN